MKRALEHSPLAKHDFNMQYASRESVESGVQCVDELSSGAYWPKTQMLVDTHIQDLKDKGSIDPNETYPVCVMPGIPFFDGAHLDSKGRSKVKAGMIACGNFRNHVLRRTCAREVHAFIPDLVTTSEQSKRTCVKLFRKRLQHKCMGKSLEEMQVRAAFGGPGRKKPIHLLPTHPPTYFPPTHPQNKTVYEAGGVLVQCNDGITRRMVPVIPFFVLDGLEARFITLVRGSSNSKRPCWICKVKKGEEEFGNPDFDVRECRRSAAEVHKLYEDVNAYERCKDARVKSRLKAAYTSAKTKLEDLAMTAGIHEVGLFFPFLFLPPTHPSLCVSFALSPCRFQTPTYLPP